jgi:nucleoid-associated protein YgaU
VRLIPEDRDCLNKISGYPFVYNDRTQWRKLYEANRDKLRDPDNPHLIFPGQVFVIPSLNGERRVGEYDPDLNYPTFGR